MRKMKKFISLIAAAAMVVTSVPISALDGTLQKKHRPLQWIPQ